MANNIKTNEIPSRESVAELLQYLNILYPKGNAIDSIKSHDKWSCSTYKYEVDEFFRLVGKKWVARRGIMDKGSDLFSNKDKIRKATWDDLKCVLTYCIRMNRFSDTGFEDAISQGVVQLVLLRMKELSAM